MANGLPFDRFRMNNIFGGQNTNQGSISPASALGIEPAKSPDLLSKYLALMKPFLQQQLTSGAMGQDAMRMDMAMQGELNKNLLAEMQRERDRPMDVVLGGTLPPPAIARETQPPEIQLGREELGLRKELGTGELALGEKQLELGREEIGAKKEIAGMEQNVNLMKQQIDIWKANNPEGVVKMDQDGNLQLINPVTGEVKPTGVKSGDLSEFEKIRLGLEGQKEVAGIRGEAQRKAAEISAVSGEKVAGIQAGKLPEAQRIRELSSRAMSVAAENPKWQKWIKMDSQGRFTKITEPGIGWGKPSEEEYNQMRQAILGTGTITQEPVIPEGLRVRDPKTGKEGTFKGTAKEATEAGYVVIGQ